MLYLDSPLHTLKGIGPKTEQLFHRIGVYSIRDILLYFPKAYEPYPQPVSVSEVTEEVHNAVVFRFSGAPVIKKSAKTVILTLRDDNHILQLIWFHMPYIASVLKKGFTYVFYGKISRKGSLLKMEQPILFSFSEYQTLSKTLQPIYGLTKGLTNKQLRKTIRLCLEYFSDLPDSLPEAICSKYHFISYQTALSEIHFPSSEDTCIQARKRFIYEEFFYFLLTMKLLKKEEERTENRFYFCDRSILEKWITKLPYPLTSAQRRSLEEILSDLNSSSCMQRLVQGDVGSGKTIVAFLAMVYASCSGYQAALMAPTEVLARQHYQKLTDFVELQNLNIPIALLTGSLKTRERKEMTELIQSHSNTLIIGTHALIQEPVTYQNLALVVTDEQHRFGVKQREFFSDKGNSPHILVMSATPIPRTLAIILYGDLDISIMDEVPQKRLPIKNAVVDTGYRMKVYQFIKKQVQLGHQAYVVCPLVEPSEQLDCENVLDYSKKLQTFFGDTLNVSFLHGKMRPEEKNAVMETFIEGSVQILVSTTVIEVGVDVPNATVMMIENAERFGLAQLHQLRGRVGRGDAQSYCIFVHTNKNESHNKRLEILNHSNDGFYIANEDLKLRGPGDLLGIRQSGDLQFALADIFRDGAILQQAAVDVGYLLRTDPDLQSEEYTKIKERLEYICQNESIRFNI